MARLTREFVKLETRILNDYRFFTMSEFEQLVYVKLLGISRSTSNRIPKESAVLVDLLRLKKQEIGFYLSQIGFSKQDIRGKSVEEQYQIGIESALKQIKSNFPKFMENKYFYHFEDYDLRLFNSVPKEKTIHGVDEDEDLDEDKELISTFWEYFLLKTKKAFRLTPDKKSLIKKRLKDGYTIEQLKKAVDNFIIDEWVGRQDHLDIIYCLGKQKGKPDSLEKWLNYKPKSNPRYD